MRLVEYYIPDDEGIYTQRELVPEPDKKLYQTKPPLFPSSWYIVVDPDDEETNEETEIFPRD